MAGPHQRRLRLTADAGFDLRLVLFSHGWIDLAPHSWDQDAERLETVLLVAGKAIDVRLRRARNHLAATLTCRGPVTDVVTKTARRTLANMLRLNEMLDKVLEPFWALCRDSQDLAWVARRRAGLIFRASSCFEDLMKLLFTTNCSWAATRGMTQRLVDRLGERTPAGRHAFPTASKCAAAGEAFFREEVRAGYRARTCHQLAAGFAGGQLRDGRFTDPELPTDELRKRLLALPGFGPYAAGQAMRLLGRYEDFALDSWCRNKLARMRKGRRPLTDAGIRRRYARFGEYRGLALWMDLTADWHGEREPSMERTLRVQA